MTYIETKHWPFIIQIPKTRRRLLHRLSVSNGTQKEAAIHIRTGVHPGRPCRPVQLPVGRLDLSRERGWAVADRRIQRTAPLLQHFEELTCYSLDPSSSFAAVYRYCRRAIHSFQWKAFGWRVLPPCPSLPWWPWGQLAFCA